jgi:hypothetical protein
VSLVRRSKFLPGSRLPAYLPITDIEKPVSSWNPFLTSRPKPDNGFRAPE